MKKIFAAFVIMLSVACSKEQVIVPAVEVQAPQVFFKDDNVSVVDVKATQTGSRQVTLKFNTEYEKNLQSIEVYSGESMSLLCRIFDAQKSETSAKANTYTIVENNISTSTHYYLVKYTTIKGEWNCSPLYRITLK